MLDPRRGPVSYKTMKVGLQRFVGYLHLHICLWVACSEKVEPNTCKLHELSPKGSVAYDGLQHPMQSPNVPLEEVHSHLIVIFPRQGYLVRWSTTTKMLSFPSDLAKASTKSIEMALQGLVGIHKGTKCLEGRVASYFSR